MQILTTAAALRSYAATVRRAGQRLGLVPTMGALHPGHLALLRRAHATTDAVVATVFVNPTQFNNPDDFRLYPRLLEADAALLEAAGCPVLFAPTPEEMYPAPTVLRFDFGPLERVMEGAHRPGHFHGVATVVSKLLHLAQPHQAFFGQKDWQQLAVVRQLVADLSFDVEIVGCPTVREVDGLAMSSRNRRLTPEGRAVAPLLIRCCKPPPPPWPRAWPRSPCRPRPWPPSPTTPVSVTNTWKWPTPTPCSRWLLSALARKPLSAWPRTWTGCG